MFPRIMKIAGCAMLAVALALPGGVHAAEQATAATIPAVVNGTLTYRERIALPPGSSAIVQLLDTSRADTQARPVAAAIAAVTSTSAAAARERASATASPPATGSTTST